MTQDNFDYFTDKEMEWTGILEHYQFPNFKHEKGTIFSIEITTDVNIEGIELIAITSLASGWTWGEDRRIKAFKLLEESVTENRLYFKFRTIRKSKRYDEIKLFLFDLGSVLDLWECKIKSISVEEM
ncbi:hypothetical protein [Paenibacillus sp. BC26]|uniref:hypothetical protein n=1 Tax=Paenibacillus sp. BC26 TaxID=1881032 RepID=UPI0008EA3433|nr:hypothetical protein [Paenibacillus sp. BC26]SFS76721.1 hypothetical protein SAMN05428962_2737 [Paenibacillus sp. BC26]